MKLAIVPPLGLLLGALVHASAPGSAAQNGAAKNATAKTATTKPASTQADGVPKYLGRELVFAAAFDVSVSSGSRTSMELGRLEFLSGNKFRATKFVFDPMGNPDATLSARREPYTGPDCQSQRIHVPTYQRSEDYSGEWTFIDEHLVLTARDGGGRAITQTWDIKSRDNKLFTLSASNRPSLAVAHGYAYISERKTDVPATQNPVQMRPSYSGAILQNDLEKHAGWKSYPFGFTLSQYEKRSPTTYRLYYSGDGGKTYGFSTLSFNAFRYSRSIFLQTFGTDFNQNSCFDDGGHSALYWGAEDQNGVVRGAVLIEQSRSTKASIVSVGYVN